MAQWRFVTTTVELALKLGRHRVGAVDRPGGIDGNFTAPHTVFKGARKQ